jgi:ABC-2 type transport system permease protein
MMNQLRSEWIKLRSVRSTWVLLFVSIGITAVVSALVGWARRNEGLAGGDTAVSLLSGFFLSMFIIGVSAVLLVSSEFRTGTIRATLAAQPNRLRLMVAKVIVVILSSLAVAIVMCGLALGIGRLLLGTGREAVVFDGSDWASVAGAIVFFVLFALWGVGLAFIIRHSAGAICALILWPLVGEGILMNIITALIKKRWLMKWMPYSAGARLFTRGGNNGDDIDLSRVAGGLYFGAFVVICLGLGLWQFRRRDA